MEVIEKNKEIFNKRAGDEINIKYMLDLRDFPGDPYDHKVVHDVEVILNYPDIQVIRCVEETAPYLGAFETDLFLSAWEEDVQRAVDAGFAAGIICEDGRSGYRFEPGR